VPWTLPFQHRIGSRGKFGDGTGGMDGESCSQAMTQMVQGVTEPQKPVLVGMS
jgi:hypothetical protein